MAADFVIGKDCKCYYNTGSWTTPVWVEITKVADLSLPLSKNEANISSRDSSYELFGAGQKNATIEFGYVHTTQRDSVTDTVFDALIAAWEGDTVTEFAVADGAIATSGTQIFRAFCIVFGAAIDQPLNEGMRFNFSLRPSRFNDSGTLREPDWSKVA